MDKLIDEIDNKQYGLTKAVQKRLNEIFKVKNEAKLTSVEINDLIFELISFPPEVTIPYLLSRHDSLGKVLKELAIKVLSRIGKNSLSTRAFLLNKLENPSGDIRFKTFYFNALSRFKDDKLKYKLLKIRWGIGSISNFYNLTELTMKRIFPDLYRIDPNDASVASEIRSKIFVELGVKNLFQEKANLAQALNYLIKAAQLDSTEPIIYCYIGYVHYLNNELNKALAEYEKALKINSNSVFALRLKAKAIYFLNQALQAEVVWQKINQLHPKDLLTYISRADAYFAKADFANAINISRQGLTFARDNVELLKILANTNYMLGKIEIANNKKRKAFNYFSKALKGYSKILENNPDDINVLLSRADIYAVQRKFQLAIADWEKIIDVNPVNPKVYFDRGKHYYRRALKEKKDRKEKHRLFELAKKDLVQSLICEKDNPSWRTLANIGNCYLGLKNYNEAVKFWKKALDICDDYVTKKQIELLIDKYNK